MADEKEAKMDENQKFQQSLMYLESIKAQLESLTNQQELLRMAEHEHSQATETLNKYKDLEEGKELLVPIGAETQVKANVGNTSDVIIGIGAKYAIEQNIEDSIKMLEKRLNQIHENRTKLDTTIEGLRQQSEMLTLEIQSMYRKLQQPGQD